MVRSVSIVFHSSHLSNYCFIIVLCFVAIGYISPYLSLLSRAINMLMLNQSDRSLGSVYFATPQPSSGEPPGERRGPCLSRAICGICVAITATLSPCTSPNDAAAISAPTNIDSNRYVFAARICIIYCKRNSVSLLLRTTNTWSVSALTSTELSNSYQLRVRSRRLVARVRQLNTA